MSFLNAVKMQKQLSFLGVGLNHAV